MTHDLREFPLSQVSQVMDVKPDTLRNWIARNPTKFRGELRGRYHWFSMREAFLFGMVNYLSEYGCPLQAAFGLAEQYIDGVPEDGPPPDSVKMFLRFGGDYHLYDYRHGIHEEAGPLAYSLVYTGRLWSVLQKRLAR